jgi:hypothetical protein
MLSSIILSLMMTTSPVIMAESNTLKLEEVGGRKGRRVNAQSLESKEVGGRKGRRVNAQFLVSKEAAGRKDKRV